MMVPVLYLFFSFAIRQSQSVFFFHFQNLSDTNIVERNLGYENQKVCDAEMYPRWIRSNLKCFLFHTTLSIRNLIV